MSWWLKAKIGGLLYRAKFDRLPDGRVIFRAVPRWRWVPMIPDAFVEIDWGKIGEDDDDDPRVVNG